jgi:hypothetical protein
MAVSVTYTGAISVIETVSDTFVSSSDNTLTFTGLNKSATLNAASSVPATIHASGEVTLSSGSATLSMLVLNGANGATVSGNGLKAQCVKFKNKATNANAITLTEGASNGYELLGNAWKVVLQPGQELQIFGNDATPDIGSSSKDIDITGTGSQVLQYQIVMG